MNVLVACEYSGRVRDAFIMYGHAATSCDLEPTEVAGPHIQDDVRNLDLTRYDLMVCHPPCRYLAYSGMPQAKNLPAGEYQRWIQERDKALDFVEYLYDAPVPRIALENSYGLLWRFLGNPTQEIHPYYFGDPYMKRTCLWLRNLPPLTPTNMLPKPISCIYEAWWYGPIKDRAKRRARTFQGIATAMAVQWSHV